MQTLFGGSGRSVRVRAEPRFISAQFIEMTPRDHEICETIGSTLKARGLIFVGAMADARLLMKALRDADEDVRDRAERALWRIDGEAAHLGAARRQPAPAVDRHLPIGRQGAQRRPEQQTPVQQDEQEVDEVARVAGELAWAADPIELFFVEIQGSGRIRMPDGSVLIIGGISADGVTGVDELVVAAEVEVQVVARDPGDGLRVEAREARDAVVLVHDVVAGAQVGEALECAPGGGGRA